MVVFHGLRLLPDFHKLAVGAILNQPVNVVLLAEVPDLFGHNLHSVNMHGLLVMSESVAPLDVLKNYLAVLLVLEKVHFRHEIEATYVPADQARPEGEFLEIWLHLNLLVFLIVPSEDNLLELIVSDAAVITVTELLRVLVVTTEGACLRLLLVLYLICLVPAPTNETPPVESMAAQYRNVEILVDRIPLLLVLPV